MTRKSITLLKVKQWMHSWEPLRATERGLPPVPEFFYIGSMPIAELRVLAGVPTRKVEDRMDKTQQPGYQRALDKNRSKKVAEYLRHGFPISSNKISGQSRIDQLVNPGWLPGAIIVNVRRASDQRPVGSRMQAVSTDDLVAIYEDDGDIRLDYPLQLTGRSEGTHPIDVIDGQHRVFSLDQLDMVDAISDFEVPVVVFDGLDLKWQAYLFWVINVEPKKINPSLAFDIYPELRRQDWLEEYDGLKVYREHRAQELTELLWRNEVSPWRNRIELLGNRRPGHISNAAFIRSLLSSFIKNAKKDLSSGGIFGSVIVRDNSDRLLRWSRAQQAALLIQIWNSLKSAVLASSSVWVNAIAADDKASTFESPKLAAFLGGHTFLATDQGVRAIHSAFNNYLRSNMDTLNLAGWLIPEALTHDDIDQDLAEAIDSLQQQKLIVDSICRVSLELIENIDWRLPTAPGIEYASHLFNLQSSYKGGSGYKLFKEKIESVLQGGGFEFLADISDEEL